MEQRAAGRQRSLTELSLLSLTQRLLLSLTSNRIRDAREFVFGFAGDRPAYFFGHPFLAVGHNIPYNSSHRD